MKRNPQPTRPDVSTWTSGEIAAVVALSAALAGSLAAPALFAGRPGAWGFPALSYDFGAAILRGLVVAGAGFAALRLFQMLHERPGSRSLRGLATAGTVLGLAIVFDLVGPATHIGDWIVLLRVAEFGELIGKWYGIAALYTIFHHGVGALLGFTPEQSVRLLSSLAGAATAYVYFRVVDHFGLTRVFKGWPFLYLSAFALTAIGLGHVEIYAVVALLVALFFWTGLRFLQSGRVSDGLVFCGVLGISLASYIGLVLLIPGGAVIWALRLWRGRRHGAQFWILLAGGAALMAVPLCACAWLGPKAADAMIPHKVLHLFRAVGGQKPDFTPSHLPRGVSWPLVRSLIRPRYWFAPWHVSGLAQVAWLTDRAGLLLLAALGALAAFRWRRFAAAIATPPVLLTASVTALFLGYGFLNINGLPYPWDWDMLSYVAVCTSLCAASLLAAFAPARGHRRAVTVLACAVALCSQVFGMHFLLSVARPPDAFGPPSAGLRLAATPTRLTLSEQRRTPVFWWLHNNSDAPVRLQSPEGLVEVGGVSPSWTVRAVPQEMGFARTLDIPAGATVCFTRIDFIPERFEVSAAVADAAQIAWRPFDEAARGEHYTGVWQVRFMDRSGKQAPLDLVSNQIDLRLTKSRGVIQ